LDSEEIRGLIELISKSNFTTFELERAGFRLKLIKGHAAAAPPAAPPHAPRAVGPEAGPPAESPGALAAAPAVEDAAEAGPPLHELRSPIVGTFYRAPGPEAAPFVEVGSEVKKGQVICIVEAMKVMNEIESEIDGEVLEILVANAHPVEYGEVLFRLRPL
jgi:acetyl-CoA carboxylase biotin carboxyl carrier protein